MNDEVGSADMTQGQGTYFVEDRFCNPNAALALNGGWTQVPPGVYFNTPEFTITVWVYPQSLGFCSRIFDFGSGVGVNNIVFSLSFDTSMKPYLYLHPTNFVPLTETLLLGKWQFLAVTFGSSELKIYLNDQIILQTTTNYNLPIVNRSSCFVGTSNWNDGYSNSFLDDLRIYNKSLSHDELIQIMNQNEENCK
jgi:large repetitive protein